MRKRQEIGRGLRIPFDENGKRVFDSEINRLTVIANESYDQFAPSLQSEIEEDCGETLDKSKIANARERKKAKHFCLYDVTFHAQIRLYYCWNHWLHRRINRGIAPHNAGKAPA